MSSAARNAIRSAGRAVPLARSAVITQSRPLVTLPSRALSQTIVSQRYAGQTPPITQAWVRYKTTKSKGWGPPIVKYDELKPITEQPNDDVVLIDVREPDEVALGSIPSSVNLPLSTLSAHLSPSYSPGQFRSAHGFDKPLPEQKIIFFCRSGKRSANAAELAGREGFGRVRNYEGSWLDWVKREKEGAGAGGSGSSKWDDDD